MPKNDRWVQEQLERWRGIEKSVTDQLQRCPEGFQPNAVMIDNRFVDCFRVQRRHGNSDMVDVPAEVEHPVKLAGLRVIFGHNVPLGIAVAQMGWDLA